MNCAESQDLLLDLAYGELEPARAADVETHVAGCPACQREKAQLEEAQKAAAPLRDLEEPSARFDGPILRAARAEAGMQADGTPGPVVEVSASVKPLGLQATRLDPHGQVRTAPAKARPRWARRAAVFASIAGAAGLAVVVSSSISRRPAAQQEVGAIRVRAPGQEPAVPAAPPALDDALARAKSAPPPPERRDSKAAPPSAAGTGLAAAEAPAKSEPKEQPTRKLAKKSRENAVGKVDGAPATKDELIAIGEHDAFGAPAAATSATAPEAATEKRRYADHVASQAVPPAEAMQRTPEEAFRAGVVESQAPKPAAVMPLVARAEMTASPDQLEDQAGAARRRGDYARAAALYRSASELRRHSEPARAAWDLAHAVECLAAGSQVDEAIAAREELFRTFPDHAGPQAAANSALRAVRPAAGQVEPGAPPR